MNYVSILTPSRLQAAREQDARGGSPSFQRAVGPLGGLGGVCLKTPLGKFRKSAQILLQTRFYREVCSMIKPYQIDQLVLLPQDIRDFLGDGHEAVIVREALDEIESVFSSKHFKTGQSHTGRPAYAPSMLVALLCYAYAIGLRSSRKIARLPLRDMGAYWLTAGERPDFRTVCLFRRHNRVALEELFSKVLVLAEQLGMLKLGIIALDGSKLRAHVTNSLSRQDQLKTRQKEYEKRIRTLIEEAEVIDQREDKLFGEDSDEVAMDESCRDAAVRKKRLREAAHNLRKSGKRGKAKELECAERAIDRIEEAKKVAQYQKCKKASTTDPDSRLMKIEHGAVVPGYNVQLAVEEQSKIIIGGTVIQDATDANAAALVLDDIESHMGKGALEGRELLADYGYFTGTNLKSFDQKKVFAIVRPEGQGNRNYLKGKDEKTEKRLGLGEFRFHRAQDREQTYYTCPQGRELRYVGTERLSSGSKRRQALPIDRRRGWKYQSKDCSKCPLASRCLLPGMKVRSLLRDPEFEPMKELQRKRFRNKANNEKYKKRMYTVEPVFADIKEHRGMRRFLLRGINGARTEWRWACLSHNLLRVGKKLLRVKPPPPGFIGTRPAVLQTH